MFGKSAIRRPAASPGRTAQFHTSAVSHAGSRFGGETHGEAVAGERAWGKPAVSKPAPGYIFGGRS